LPPDDSALAVTIERPDPAFEMEYDIGVDAGGHPQGGRSPLS